MISAVSITMSLVTGSPHIIPWILQLAGLVIAECLLDLGLLRLAGTGIRHCASPAMQLRPATYFAFNTGL